MCNDILRLFSWFGFLEKQPLNKTSSTAFLYLFAKTALLLLKKFKLEKAKWNGIVSVYLSQILEKIDPNILKKSKAEIFNILQAKDDLRFLLASEIIYTFLEMGIPFSSEKKRALSSILQLSTKQIKTAALYTKERNLSKFQNSKQYYIHFWEYQQQQKKYEELKVFNIAVCATMSAGKSTFINALLGADYLPARNEATTAKITSVYDNDFSTKMIGYCLDAEKKVIGISGAVSSQTIDQWNQDKVVSRIILQDDLDNIRNANAIIAVHDTPGTNNSATESHHKATFEFLANSAIDAILFVTNAEQMQTTDEQRLLKEIYGQFVQTRNIPVLFIINKADSVDFLKENFKEMCQSFKSFINSIGYKDCPILPISAKAARLFKMALKGNQSKFTDSELDKFHSFFSKFSHIAFDERKQANIDISKKVNVDGVLYDAAGINMALTHTGIKKVETTIENLIRKD